MNKMVSFKDVNIYTESFGSIENPAILLIMGAASSLVWWEEEFCKKLVDAGFFVIRYDNRDTGKSTCYPPGKPGYTFEEMADDAIYVLDAYGIEKAIIMGMSMGGMLTQMIALRHPDRVKGIVLLGSMYFAEGAEKLPVYSKEVKEFFETYGKVEPKDDDELLEYAFKQWSTTNKSSRFHDEDHIRKLIKIDMERANDYRSRVNHSYAQVTGDELFNIDKISLPTLVIHGTEDAVIPYIHGEMLKKTIKGAAFHVMKGAGHELNKEDYDDVIDNILKIFK